MPYNKEEQKKRQGLSEQLLLGMQSRRLDEKCGLAGGEAQFGWRRFPRCEELRRQAEQVTGATRTQAKWDRT